MGDGGWIENTWMLGEEEEDFRGGYVDFVFFFEEGRNGSWGGMVGKEIDCKDRDISKSAIALYVLKI